MKAIRVGLAALCLATAGCGAEEGVGEDATVSVYAAPPLCAGAQRALAREGGETEGLEVRLVCLRDAEPGGRLDLAQVGANARGATEDSSAVGYIGEPTLAATRFSRPILEAADIAQLSQSSGRVAMAKLLRAIRAVDTSGSLRESVSDELE